MIATLAVLGVGLIIGFAIGFMSGWRFRLDEAEREMRREEEDEHGYC